MFVCVEVDVSTWIVCDDFVEDYFQVWVDMDFSGVFFLFMISMYFANRWSNFVNSRFACVEVFYEMITRVFSRFTCEEVDDVMTLIVLVKIVKDCGKENDSVCVCIVWDVFILSSLFITNGWKIEFSVLGKIWKYLGEVRTVLA